MVVGSIEKWEEYALENQKYLYFIIASIVFICKILNMSLL